MIALAALCPTLAAAQHPPLSDDALPEGLGFPDRARAILPTGMALGRTEWEFLEWEVDRRLLPSLRRNTIRHERRVRVPYESLLIEVSMAGAWVDCRCELMSWDFPISGTFTAVATEAPELGAYFRDAPIPGVRYELGGALTIPVASRTAIEGVATDIVPWDPNWNEHRTRPETIAFLLRTRWEFDLHPHLVLGAEVSFPITIDFEGGVTFLPQGALEVAARFLGASLVGLRLELTRTLSAYGELARVLAEPFLRIVFEMADHTAAYVRVSARMSPEPTHIAATGSGASFETGVLF